MSDNVNIIDIKKSYRTRDGRKVEIFRTNLSFTTHPYSVVGMIEGEDTVDYWMAHGRDDDYYQALRKDSPVDLIECRPSVVVTRWISYYKNREGEIDTATTKNQPSGDDPSHYITTHKVEMEITL